MWLVSIHERGGLEGSQEGRSRGMKEMFLVWYVRIINRTYIIM